jgi:uncharacterized hydrophobic protein (TIGR00271 family)
MYQIFQKFKLGAEKENLPDVVANMSNGVIFRGTNLWVLIFAIFIASLGLNVNSTAVIIGAMLISPLMGPIMGLGLGLGINDISLLRKAAYNYLVATATALTTSTIFFLISPLSEAHSEILARTSPNIYDVLIAIFGGLSGIVASLSRTKGNVIPGVAIATALMPPLCTAGYGLATLQWNYFFGAFYLYIINTVFIAWATLIVVRLFHFPLKHLQNRRADKIAQRVVWIIVMATFIPSVYFGYDLVQQEKFKKKANNFILNEAHFPNDYLLNKTIDPKGKSITLVFGGSEIGVKEIDDLKKSLPGYGLSGTQLDIKQGFAYLSDQSDLTERNQQVEQLKEALAVQEESRKLLQFQLDSIKTKEQLGMQVFEEIKTQYPVVRSAFIQSGPLLTDSSKTDIMFVVIDGAGRLSPGDKRKLEDWLKVRFKNQHVNVVLQ